jgi:glycosyltransferase involved in cell wall biosynthesis
MSSTQAVLLGIYAVLVAIWPIRFLVLKHVLARTQFLTPASPPLAQPDPPLVSAVIPARDEEVNLAPCLESVCRQEYPRLEILVIDDRSTDRTGQIARELASRDPRLRVLANDHLPAGWTGKTHVLHVAAQETRGGWLWFLDADTIHAAEFLAVMMEYAREQKAAMVSLLPELRCDTFWEQLVQPLAAVALMQSFPLHRVNDDRSGLAFANGQSILIERGAYDAAGGHAAVRDRFVEDIAMASKVKALPRPIRTVLVRDLVTCRMYASLSQLIRGWSRIFYDALDRKPWRLVCRLLDPLIFCQSGHIALIASVAMVLTGNSGPFAWWLLILSLAHHALMYPVFRLVYQASVPGSRFAAWFPLGNLLTDYILLRAIWMSLTGRVTWRGTSYGADKMRTEHPTTTSKTLSTRAGDAARRGRS